MSNVSQEKADEILAALKEAEPELEIIGRDQEGWHKLHWQLWLAWAGVWLVGLVMPQFAKRWRESYTIVTSKHIAYPEMPATFTKYSTYSTLRHEYIHLRDRLAHPIWFPFSYAVVLPAVWTMRAHWELRGYTANMLVSYELSGRVSDEMVDWIVKQFTTDRYFWMWPFEDKVRARVEEIRDKVLAEEISGLYF